MAIRAASMLPGMECADAAQQAVIAVRAQQLHPHMEQLLYQLANAAAAPAALQAADAGQQVRPALQSQILPT